MKKEFLVNVVFLISINLLIKPFYIFGIDRTVQNMVGSETYGIYAALLSLTYLFQIINDLGIQNYNNRNIAQHNQLLSKYFPNIILMKGLLASLFMAAIFIFAFIVGYDQLRFEWLALLGINQILVSYIFYLRSNISGLGRYRTDSVLSVLDKLLMICICIVLLWVSPFKENFRIEWFIIAQTASYLVSALTAYFIVKPYLKKVKWGFRKEFLVLIIKKSYPYAFVIFLMQLYTRIDQVMIERLLPDGAEETGIYAAAFRLLDASNMIGVLFAGLLLPMFAKMLKNKERIDDLVWFSFKMLFSAIIVISVSCYFWRNELMNLLYVEATPYWGDILGILMFSFIGIGTTHIFGTLLTANGNMKVMNIIAFCGVAFNIALNFILIAKFKAYGASIATLGTQVMVSAAQIALALKIFGIKVPIDMLVRLAIFCILTVAMMYGAYYYSPVDWKISAIIAVAFSLFLTIPLGVFQRKVLLQFLKQ